MTGLLQFTIGLDRGSTELYIWDIGNHRVLDRYITCDSYNGYCHRLILTDESSESDMLQTYMDFFTWLLINTLVISKNWMVGQKNCYASTNVWSWLGHGFWGWLWGGAKTHPLLPSPQPEESIRAVENARRGVLWESEAGQGKDDGRAGRWQHLYQIVS